jgi:hypothetical protein
MSFIPGTTLGNLGGEQLKERGNNEGAKKKRENIVNGGDKVLELPIFNGY